MTDADNKRNGFYMEKAYEIQESGSSETESSSRPILRLAQDVSKWAKNFFTLTEEEKEAAGICDYKKYDRF